MNTPLVSVIVPAYNPGRYLDETLESILAQSYSAMEIIVVDDGSSPPCDTLSRFAPIVKFFRQTHSGMAQARNYGVARSQGELVAFCSAKDILMAEKIEQQVDVLLNNSTIGFVMTNVKNFFDASTVMPKWLKGKSFLEVQQGFVSTALIRRSVLDLVGLFDVRLRADEDLDWLIRARELGVQMETLDDVLVKRRIHISEMASSLKLSESSLMRMLREPLVRRRYSSATS